MISNKRTVMLISTSARLFISTACISLKAERSRVPEDEIFHMVFLMILLESLSSETN